MKLQAGVGARCVCEGRPAPLNIAPLMASCTQHLGHLDPLNLHKGPFLAWQVADKIREEELQADGRWKPYSLGTCLVEKKDKMSSPRKRLASQTAYGVRKC